MEQTQEVSKTVSQNGSSMEILKDKKQAFDRYVNDSDPLDWGVDILTIKHTKLYEIANKFNEYERVRHFDFIAPNYEGLYERAGWPDPKEVALMVKEMTNGKKPTEIKILDFGCGTGLVGKYLAEEGFTNITGIDCSPKMIEIAESKGCYKSVEELTLGNPNEFPNKWKNQFDITVCAGLINNNHLDYKLIEEMIMATKLNGMLIFAARYSFMGNYWYNFLLNEVEHDGRIQKLKQKDFFKYDQLTESMGRFSKTPSRAYAFKNLCPEIRGWKEKKADDGVFTAFPKDKDS